MAKGIVLLVLVIKMDKHDVIVLLGSEPNLETWEFPQQIHNCTKTVAGLIKAGVSNKVIASGKWSRVVENKSLPQPFLECEKLTELLLAKGVPKAAILRECISTDTISNLYYIKTQFLIPQKWKNVLFVVADFRIARLDFLCSKVFGPDWRVSYNSVRADEGVSYNEARTIERSKAFLAPMKDGDHEWLADKLFDDPFYAQSTKRHQQEG